MPEKTVDYPSGAEQLHLILMAIRKLNELVANLVELLSKAKQFEGAAYEPPAIVEKKRGKR